MAGCGPAGLAAALLLHRDGHRVTLFERFEAPRPIGSGLMLQPTGLAVLRHLGLEDALVARGARIARLTGEADGRTVLDVHYAALRGERFGLGIHRASLFEMLHEAVIAAGIPIRTGCEVRDVIRGDDAIRLRTAGGDSSAGDLVIDALGARSPLAAGGRGLAYGALWATLPWQAGFDPAALQQRYRRASVMAGVLPTGQGQAAFFWSLRADRLEAWRAAGLDAWKAEVAALWPATQPLLDAIVDPDQLTFARYAHRTLAAPAAPRLIHIGDAWHSTSPQLGQGANMALLDAFALAKALREGESLSEALAHAVALRRRHVRLYQAMSRVLTPVYQSDGRLVPLVRDRLVGPISRLRPVMTLQAAMVSGLVGNPLRPLGLG
ncbi:NAD(P)/FAD-dependent oxidoreductase [Sphingomonas sp. HF-S4]|uniref:NAD(P)/FAD-dependent oxidoreductase n=1 Tax=Sphingomonas agrestis TaxID=3080540 RepID=A0ABU3YBG5_9SPHN|nr:NAD(P)/FAD-dependent oxidoreductase [Sphingomonas sp. HF-S4]MDV3458716.1 NAD(P)/FAD-dependent oxidoreductase [Sphingomonas sp. HF-S4]